MNTLSADNVQKSVTSDKKINICGVWIDNLTMTEAIERIDELVLKNEPVSVVTPNVDHIVRLQKDTQFRRIYDRAALVLPDGVPLLWAARFFGKSFKAKISGSDLVVAQCPRIVERGYKLFFLGGRPGAAQKAKENLEKKYPTIRIVGIYSPPFGFERDVTENARIVEQIKKASPDILLVGLGAPKQEKWIHDHLKEMGVPVSIGVGVTFEFIAGFVKRAPLLMQRLGFEWLWRLLMEPRRLWKRYLVEDPQFFWMLLKQRANIL